MSDALAEFATQAGLHSVREIVVPELATPRIRQPRADIQMWGHPSLPLLHGDATVISTHRRAANVARATPGAAADAAERAKARKYGEAGGVSVLGLCMEFGGRHGPRLQQLLGQLASLARQQCALAGAPATRAPLRAWRQKLAVLLGRAIAALVSTAVEPHR